jgi:hypothetical protein
MHLKTVDRNIKTYHLHIIYHLIKLKYIIYLIVLYSGNAFFIYTLSSVQFESLAEIVGPTGFLLRKKPVGPTISAKLS